MQWYLRVLQNYANFSGRARRKEYWMFTLVNTLISMAVSIPTLFFEEGSGAGIFANLLELIYSLALLIPSLAVLFRRLHDTGRSGAWFLLVLIPVIGWVVLFIFMCLDSEPTENTYGPNPKIDPLSM